MNAKVSKVLANLPQRPGVYIMKDIHGTVIYVGKAKNLKNRVSSYFHGGDGRAMLAMLIPQIDDIELIMTDTELEALVLECGLIKKHQPKYNALLKDGKQYPFIKVTTKDVYPRFTMVRRMEKDGSRYFGPYSGTSTVFETIKLLRELFGINACRYNTKPKNGKPCLYYRIGVCGGFCLGLPDKEQYRISVRQAMRFLAGTGDDWNAIKRETEELMLEASERMEYEKAALYRDRLKNLEQLENKQKILSESMEDRDAVAVYGDENDAMIQLFVIRSGRLMASDHFYLENCPANGEALSAFTKQYYSDDASRIPKTILFSEDFEDRSTLEEYFTELRGNRVYSEVPAKGEKRQLIEMAISNAEKVWTEQEGRAKKEHDRTIGALEELQRLLGLQKFPHRIEGFDISHIQGTDTVASMVVSEDGVAKNSDYRRFKINSATNNDFVSMSEVIRRRFTRLREAMEGQKYGTLQYEDSFSKLPDLVLIDGGKGQLSSARAVMEELGFDGIFTIGLAERLEEIYLVGQSEPIVLSHDTPALQVLQRLRDEAHRFAITYHRSLRDKERTRSTLLDIPGIGEKRAAALLKRFGSVKRVSLASEEELSAVPEMNAASVAAILEYFSHVKKDNNG